jgi:ribosome biogenesis protein YTM1
LHTGPLSSIVANASASHLLTASWDTLIGLWDTNVPDVDEVPEENFNERERKKRRVDSQSEKRATRKAPLVVLKSHTGRVSKAVFGAGADAAKAYSCGFDSTVRLWDTETGLCTQTIALLSLVIDRILINDSPTDCLRKTVS